MSDAPGTHPPHDAFVARYAAGRLRVEIDRAAAARFVGARMLLPAVLLALLGIAVLLALSGRWIAGLALFALALGLRLLVRASAHGFVLARALRDPVFYAEAGAAGLLRVRALSGDALSHPQDGNSATR